MIAFNFPECLSRSFENIAFFDTMSTHRPFKVRGMVLGYMYPTNFVPAHYHSITNVEQEICTLPDLSLTSRKHKPGLDDRSSVSKSSASNESQVAGLCGNCFGMGIKVSD